MNNTSSDKITASREAIRAFAQHYNYDVGYVEALMDASPGAFSAYETAMPMGQYQKAAPTDLLMIAKLATTQVEDCGPCLELGVKIARESKVPESIIRGHLARRARSQLGTTRRVSPRFFGGRAKKHRVRPVLPRQRNRAVPE